MKTIITKKIDDFDVVVAVGNADGFVDAEATKKKVIPVLADTEVYKKIDDIKKQMQTYVNYAQQAKQRYKVARSKTDKDKLWNEYVKYRNLATELQEPLKPLAVELQEKQKELLIEHAEYFVLRGNEHYITDIEGKEFGELIVEAVQAGEVVTKDKEKIVDNRGRKFWIKSSGTWINSEITKLGDVPTSGAIEEKDLLDEQTQEISEQLETKRIANLTTAQKKIEKDLKIINLITRAGQMKSELEVQGDAEALSKSQNWLSEETAKLDMIY